MLSCDNHVPVGTTTFTPACVRGYKYRTPGRSEYMSNRLCARARRAVPFAVAAIVLMALTIAVRLPALAAPATLSENPPLAVTLEESATTVPLDGEMGYTAHVRLDEPASYLQTRLQVRLPSGKLVYQRTQVENSPAVGTWDFPFNRPLEGLDLKPGVYPLTLSIRADFQSSSVTTEIAGELLVYDPASPPVPVVLIARLHGPPLSDSAGHLVIDPATPAATKNRDDVSTISAMILADPQARIVLAIPPVLLAEWKRLTSGYTLTDGTAVPAENPVPASYATMLSTLRSAMDTGRLELVSLGYADPDLTALAQESLAKDVTPQYESGVSACFASLETTPSTGTVPAGDCVPTSMLASLDELGIGYAAVSASCVKSGKAQAATGVYPVVNSRITALVTDDQSSLALSSGETTPALRRVFKRSLSSGKPIAPFAIRIDLGGDRASATSLISTAVTRFEAQPWARLTLGRDLRVPSKVSAVSLVEGKSRSKAPAGYWKTVRSARIYAGAMLAALGQGDANAVSVQADSLLAESAAWSEPAGTWSSAARGLSFAALAVQRGRDNLGGVRVKAEPVTFAGAKGEVPVNITNGSDNTLAVVVRATPQGGLQVVGGNRIPTTLRPQETFVPIPVDMKSALSGTLKVEVVAGDLVLAHDTVKVSASYLDRLAIIGGIVFALVVLLIFIVRRVRSAENREFERQHGPNRASSQRDADDGDEDEGTDTE